MSVRKEQQGAMEVYNKGLRKIPSAEAKFERNFEG